MPERKTIERARKAKRQGKAPSTQAGEFVREEFEHIREGKHGARSTKQAIAIGLSKARRAGVKLPPPEKGTTSERTRKSAASAYRAGQAGRRLPGVRVDDVLPALGDAGCGHGEVPAGHHQRQPAGVQRIGDPDPPHPVTAALDVTAAVDAVPGRARRGEDPRGPLHGPSLDVPGGIEPAAWGRGEVPAATRADGGARLKHLGEFGHALL